MSIQIESPIESRVPKVSHQEHKAAGMVGVLVALSHVFRAMNPFRGVKVLLKLNQKRGFDCPGCAWPDPDDHRHAAEFCENGAKAVAEEATTATVTPEVFKKWSVAQLSELGDFEIGKLGRLTDPMVLREGATHYEPISWPDAFAMIARTLNTCQPDEATFYTSGRASNEAAFTYQLLVRLYGTNNLPDCSNMCHESSGAALQDAIGIGKGTVTLEDFNHADCIVVIGQNPGTNHPRMLTALQKAAKNGCEIISINPLQEAGLEGFMNPQQVGGMLGIPTKLAKVHLPVRINGDVAVLKGIMKLMLEAEAASPGSVLQRDFIDEKTVGFDDFKANLEQTSWASIEKSSGLTRAEIEKAAKIIIRSKRMISCWAMGLTQHKNGVANIQEVVNMHLLAGQMGRQGAGLCPVRGHSNVQGDRTMGIYEKPSKFFLDSLEKEFGFNPPREHGFDVVESIHKMFEGKIRFFMGLGGNFLSATPDTEMVAAGLRKCELTVQVSTKLNRSHLVTGKTALILPCLGRTERDVQASGAQFVTTENSMSVVEASEGRLSPPSKNVKSETSIILELAEAVFREQPEKLKKADWKSMRENYDVIREHIARVVPGFANFNSRIKKERFFYLPNGVRDAGRFDNDVKKGKFTVHPIPVWDLKQDQYLLMTFRSHDQFNTTIYGQNDRYRGVHGGRRVVFMNKDDIRDAGFKAGMAIDLTSVYGTEHRQVKKFKVIEYNIPRGCVAAYYPETNPLVPIEAVADKSNTPAYKSVVVQVAAHG